MMHVVEDLLSWLAGCVPCKHEAIFLHGLVARFSILVALEYSGFGAFLKCYIFFFFFCYGVIWTMLVAYGILAMLVICDIVG